MGAGKTTVGRILAETWGVGFRDSDQDVEAAAGRSVSDIFVDSGEAEFRALERAAVATALAEHDGVLALGGGAVLDESTRERARRAPGGVPAGGPERRGPAGRARASPGRSCSATCAAGSSSLIDERTPVYESVATDVVDTDGLSVDEVVERVRAAVEDASHE